MRFLPGGCWPAAVEDDEEMVMDFFDVLLPLGRTNFGSPESPCSQAEALTLMDRYGVSEAMVFHTLSRDSNPDLGNATLLKEIDSPRLHRIWGFDPVFVKKESPVEFLDRALRNHVKAILVNPHMRDVRIDRSVRLGELASLMEARKIPLLVASRTYHIAEDVVNWHHLADFCLAHPNLPVISWEFRSRANRPMFDAMAVARNLRVSLASVWQSQMLEQICETYGPDRLLFSLGLPMLDPGTFPMVVRYAGVDENTRNAVAGGNLRNILKEAKYA